MSLSTQIKKIEPIGQKNPCYVKKHSLLINNNGLDEDAYKGI